MSQTFDAVIRLRDRASGTVTKLNKQLEMHEKTWKKVGKSVKETGRKIADVGKGMSAAVTAPVVAGVGASIAAMQEYGSDLARLETNAKMANRSLAGMTDQLLDAVAITGEADSSIEGLSNLLATGFSDAGLDKITDSLLGASIKWSDTLKFEGLADGLQETLATG